MLMSSAAVASANAAPVGTNTVESGNDVALKRLPPFSTRILVPLIPSAENVFRIEDSPITSIIETPAGFTTRAVGSSLAITAPAGEQHGYMKVMTGGREVTLTLITTVPFAEVRGGKLRGYQIGTYAATPLKGLATYERPTGFIHLTDANADVWVSDHYRLRDFQCKLDGANKFLVLRPEALIKLELMQQKLANERGLAFDRFTVMSGYRTPYYNSKIGNETGYSRHLYGDAMDIYIDTNADGSMDDISRDGRVDKNDAMLLLSYAEQIDKSADWSWLQGGAGVYKANHAHGPYLHIDTRGYVARWGV
jgi:hypothetical protein